MENNNMAGDTTNAISEPKEFTVSLRFHLTTNCAHCAQPMVINSFDFIHTCDQCGKDTPIDKKDWSTLVEEAMKRPNYLPTDKDKTSLIMGGRMIRLTYRKSDPLCAGCGGTLALPSESHSQESGLVCLSCNAILPLRKATAEQKQVIPSLKWVAGEELSAVHVRQTSTSSSDSLTALTHGCPSCGARLEVDGKNKVVTCKYCLSTVTISDNAWRKLNPVKTKKEWYVIFTIPNYWAQNQKKWEKPKLTEEQIRRRKLHKERLEKDGGKKVDHTKKKRHLSMHRVWFEKTGGYNIVFVGCLAAAGYSWARSTVSLASFLIENWFFTGAIVCTAIFSVMHYFQIRKKFPNGTWEEIESRKDNDDDDVNYDVNYWYNSDKD